MITLITGTPGSGKTLYTVAQLDGYVKQGRRVVVDGIRDLAVEHELVDEQWMRKWYEHCRPNDVIVVDEVQRYWPPVSASSKPTEDIEKLHVHRHLGVDFIVITQHPQRMNKTIRDLVGRHVHVRRMLGMHKAMLYEWDSTRNPNGSLRDAVKTWWSYPKDVFKLYTSAELHTKPKAVIPKALFIIPVALAVLVGGVVVALHRLRAMGQPKGVPVGAVAAGAGGSGGSGAAAGAQPVAAWRVVGSYAVDGEPYVLLVGADGWVRSVPRSEFKGEQLRLEGTVDGQRVSVWSGAPIAGGGVK